MAVATAVIFGFGAWCAALALVALLDRLPRPAFGWVFACATLLLVPALVSMWLTRDDTSAAGAFGAFGCGLAAWAWQEVGGSPRHGRRRGGHALDTSLAQEIAWVVFVAAAGALAWDGSNLARWTLPALWLLHLSMRLNALAQDHASGGGPLLRPPWFAPGLPAAQLLSAVFPLTVTALTGAAALTLAAALAAETAAGAATALGLVGGALAGGVIGHWGLVVRAPAWRLPPVPHTLRALGRDGELPPIGWAGAASPLAGDADPS